jgi:hypothetical protein
LEVDVGDGPNSERETVRRIRGSATILAEGLCLSDEASVTLTAGVPRQASSSKPICGKPEALNESGKAAGDQSSHNRGSGWSPHTSKKAVIPTHTTQNIPTHAGGDLYLTLAVSCAR